LTMVNIFNICITSSRSAIRPLLNILSISFIDLPVWA
jgi:hypothetical protein